MTNKHSKHCNYIFCWHKVYICITHMSYIGIYVCACIHVIYYIYVHTRIYYMHVMCMWLHISSSAVQKRYHCTFHPQWHVFILFTRIMWGKQDVNEVCELFLMFCVWKSHENIQGSIPTQRKLLCGYVSFPNGDGKKRNSVILSHTKARVSRTDRKIIWICEHIYNLLRISIYACPYMCVCVYV